MNAPWKKNLGTGTPTKPMQSGKSTHTELLRSSSDRAAHRFPDEGFFIATEFFTLAS